LREESVDGRIEHAHACRQGARRLVVASLKDDHKDVKRALREFEKLDARADAPRMQALVARTLALLEMHATLELELFYPALRAAAVEGDLVDEAEIEHASMTALIEQTRRAGPSDAKYVARIKVLGEYVRHHVQEEEKPCSAPSGARPVRWEELAAAMAARRMELMRPASSSRPVEGRFRGRRIGGAPEAHRACGQARDRPQVLDGQGKGHGNDPRGLTRARGAPRRSEPVGHAERDVLDRRCSLAREVEVVLLPAHAGLDAARKVDVQPDAVAESRSRCRARSSGPKAD
jgi:hypothetical protein